MAVTVKYGAATLATANDGQTVIVNCEDRKMQENISVVVPPAEPQLVKGTFAIDSQSYGGTVTFGFIIGMDWDLFLQTVGEAAGYFIENENGNITVFGGTIYYDGMPITKQDVVVNGATYTD